MAEVAVEKVPENSFLNQFEKTFGEETPIEQVPADNFQTILETITPKEETVVVEPSVVVPVVETTPLPPEEIKPVVIDELPDWLKNQTPLEVKTPEAQTEEYKNAVAENEALKKQLDSPAIKLILDAQASGKSIIDVLNEIKPVDYSKVSDKDLYENEIKLNFPDITEDELLEEIEKFGGMSLLDKKIKCDSIRAKRSEEANQKLNQFVTGSNESKLAEQAQLRNVLNEATVAYDFIKTTYHDKEYKGLHITEDRAAVIEKEFTSGRVNANPNGTFTINVGSMKEVYDLLVFKNYGGDLVKANITKVASTTAEKVLLERTRVQASNGSLITPAKTDAEDFNSDMKAHIDNQKQKTY